AASGTGALRCRDSRPGLRPAPAGRFGRLAARRRRDPPAGRPAGRSGNLGGHDRVPAARAVRAEERELFAALTSHLAQVLARARDYAQARAVALTLQQAILGPTKLPHGFAARYVPAVEPLEVGGDWYDVVPMPGHR